jgi:hypothetical protein
MPLIFSRAMLYGGKQESAEGRAETSAGLAEK